MAGPGLPVDIDATYADTGDASVKLHQQYHDLLHTVANDFDTANAATAGFVPVGDGTVLVARALLSTDNPGVVVNTQTASYTAALSDAGKVISMNVSSTANNFTIPLNSSVNFPLGTLIEVFQYGSGVTTVVAAGGVTIRTALASTVIAARYGFVSLWKHASDEWIAS